MDPDSEQIFHDLEQRHVLLRKEHDVVCIEKEAFKGNRHFLKTRSTFQMSISCHCFNSGQLDFES